MWTAHVQAHTINKLLFISPDFVQYGFFSFSTSLQCTFATTTWIWITCWRARPFTLSSQRVMTSSDFISNTQTKILKSCEKVIIIIIKISKYTHSTLNDAKPVELGTINSVFAISYLSLAFILFGEWFRFWFITFWVQSETFFWKRTNEMIKRKKISFRFCATCINKKRISLSENRVLVLCLWYCVQSVLCTVPTDDDDLMLFLFSLIRFDLILKQNFLIGNWIL